MKTLTKKYFYFLCALALLDVVLTLLGYNLTRYKFIDYFFLVSPVCMLVMHAVTTLAVKRGFFFIFLAAIVGLVMEIVGLNTGTVFGGNYIYNSRAITLWDVPLEVILYWAVFIYTGYSIVNSWMYYFLDKKPSIKDKNWLTMLLLIGLDGYVVTAIDLFMDPIQVNLGFWTWIDGGPYFGVPIGNFVGWFLVTIIVTSMFRTYEYFYPAPELRDDFLLTMPTVAYALLLLSFIVSGVELKLFSLIPFGIAFMLPVIITSIFLRMKRPRQSSSPLATQNLTQAAHVPTKSQK